ncbi:hypothetical protein [Arthrobacter sp. ISL-5]|uniref:hypothetical protein n=1 Tax=Arthrobacter sp. ISL-5 TaxID=2819111 RepID=UPI002034C2D1|nr:hypothetical protein [Arthrobacter sp. ISL-5]
MSAAPLAPAYSSPQGHVIAQAENVGGGQAGDSAADDGDAAASGRGLTSAVGSGVRNACGASTPCWAR